MNEESLTALLSSLEATIEEGELRLLRQILSKNHASENDPEVAFSAELDAALPSGDSQTTDSAEGSGSKTRIVSKQMFDIAQKLVLKTIFKKAQNDDGFVEKSQFARQFDVGSALNFSGDLKSARAKYMTWGPSSKNDEPSETGREGVLKADGEDHHQAVQAAMKDEALPKSPELKMFDMTIEMFSLLLKQETALTNFAQLKDEALTAMHPTDTYVHCLF